jgi:ubiquinone/menaquinone biosynthesis C-methylase UbiE
MKSDFDEYHDSYDDVIDDAIAFAGVEHAFFIKAKADYLKHQLQLLYGDTKDLKVIDVGCGVGKMDAHLLGTVQSVSGVDISEACIERARLENPQVDYRAYDGLCLPYGDEAFDVAFMVCVLHHVEPVKRLALMREVNRVVRPGGAVFIFEHNPWHVLTRIVVYRCEFDRDAILLSKRKSIELLKESGLQYGDAQYILYTPFDFPALEGAAFLRRSMPFGTQYFALGIKNEN